MSPLHPADYLEGARDKMLLLDSADVKQLVDMEAAIAASSAAFAWTSSGAAVTPVRQAISLGGHSVTLFMPGFLPKQGILGLKVGSLVEGNQARGLPATICTVMLVDPATGEAAALIEATWLTALRTGAGVGAASLALAPAMASRAAMLGAGGMAYHLIEAVLTACPTVKEMAIHNRTHERGAKLLDRVAAAFGDRCRFELAASARSAVEQADIVTACTSTNTPLFNGKWIKPGAHVNLAGAHGRTMREADDELMHRAAVVAVDQADGALASGEIAIPLESGALDRAKLIEIGAVINGDAAGKRSAGDITVFKSCGIAAQDMATAAIVLQRARERGMGTSLDLRPAD